MTGRSSRAAQPLQASDRDRGSASLWVLSCCLLLCTVAAVSVLRGGAVLARHRAESAADLAALAGAARIGIGRDACAAARRVAARNGSQVSECRVSLEPDPRVGTVTVRVEVDVSMPFVGTRQVGASARAGRLAATTATFFSVAPPARGAVAC